MTYMLCQRQHFTLALSIAAAAKHLFYSSFTDKLTLSFSIFNHNAHTPSFKVKRNFIYFFITVDQ